MGQPDRFARLKRIEQLDLDSDYHAIAALFYTDFQTIMLALSFNNS